MNSIQRRAAGLALPSSQRAAAAVPDVRLLPPSPTGADLRGLARCFCAIYGSAEHALDGEPIWGEGWRCRYCATEAPATASGRCARCGGQERSLIHHPEEIERALAHDLKPRADWHPAACVLERRGQTIETVGFAFGAVTTRQRAAAQLGKKLREYESELSRDGIDLDRVDLKNALPARSPIFYMDELCIELDARDGITSLKGLAAVLFAAAAELGARDLVGFTSRRAAPFPLITAGGGELALELGELVVFRIIDFLPLAALLHHASADELISLLAQASPPALSRTPRR